MNRRSTIAAAYLRQGVKANQTMTIWKQMHQTMATTDQKWTMSQNHDHKTVGVAQMVSRAALNRRLTASIIVHHQVGAEQMVNRVAPTNWRQTTIIITRHKIVRVEQVVP